MKTVLKTFAAALLFTRFLRRTAAMLPRA